jgi:putative endonuclease
MQHFWVYMLRCSDGSYYTGHTDNLEKRLWEHDQGLAADWTRRRRPVELVWCMTGGTRDEVFAMERRIKNWSRAKKEALIAGDWNLVGYFARPPKERADGLYQRPSTTLGTSGFRTAQPEPASLVPSEVEGRAAGYREGP